MAVNDFRIRIRTQELYLVYSKNHSRILMARLHFLQQLLLTCRPDPWLTVEVTRPRFNESRSQ